jgi:hypothetical protein
MVIKALIMSLLGDWVGKNLEIVLNTPKHDQFLTFCIAISFKHLILKYITTLLIKLNLLNSKPHQESKTQLPKSEIDLINLDDPDESSFSLISQSESELSQKNENQTDQ